MKLWKSSWLKLCEWADQNWETVCDSIWWYALIFMFLATADKNNHGTDQWQQSRTFNFAEKWLNAQISHYNRQEHKIPKFVFFVAHHVKPLKNNLNFTETDNSNKPNYMWLLSHAWFHRLMYFEISFVRGRLLHLLFYSHIIEINGSRFSCLSLQFVTNAPHPSWDVLKTIII